MSETDRRIDALVGAMSWADKLAQLQIAYHPDPVEAGRMVAAGIGGVFWPRNAAATNGLQRIAMTESRHGIPLLIGLDVIHGQRTIFPIPLAQAAGFDPDVSHLDGRVSAAEAASGGVNWAFAPMVDVSRDPRWGRVVEGFGEDAYLNAVFGAAKVRGFQGGSLSDPDSIAACVKHFVGYGAAEGGRDYNTVDVSEERLRGVYLPPFRAAVDAGAATVMASFNTVAGSPVHANRRLLTEILKQEWGFQGFIVGDADGVANLIPHGVAEDLPDALRQAFGAGLDMEMGGHVVDVDGVCAVGPGEIDPDRIDDAVRRILRLKIELGLFDRPFVDETKEMTAPSAATRTAARGAARRCPVLLVNDGTLPLAPDPGRILLVGPYSDSTDHLGAWVQSFGAPAGTLADALAAALPTAVLTVLPGASFFGQDPSQQAAAAVAAADADVIVVAVGEPSSITGEAASRSDLRLPGDQEHLIAAIAATGRPFVVVLIIGRPLVLSAWIDLAPTVLVAWHLGTEAAPAIADLLTGVVDPAGRLPMAFPRSVGQVPIYYDHENTGRPATTEGTLEQEEIDIGLHGPANLADRYTSKYRDLPLGPLFGFGHGLGYTTFQYDPPTLSTPALAWEDLRAGGRVTVSVRVRNTGSRRADEVVQLYVRDRVASLAPPVRRLRGFARITLDPGAGESVEISIDWDDLAFWREHEQVVEPGWFDFYVGGTLESATPVAFAVTERTMA